MKNKTKFGHLTIEGDTPLLMHNGRTANPLDDYTKKLKLVTSKRKKTDEDLQNILNLQWEASLYWDETLGVYMPVENLQTALWKACKHYKLGNKVSAFVFQEKKGFPIYTMKKEKWHKLNNWEELCSNPDFRFNKVVSIQRAKALTCRAIFPTWKIEITFLLDETILSETDATMILNNMGSRIGLGVWTPSHLKPGNFGKFIITFLEFSDK